MQSNPRILVNVLVILVKILVNLLVKLTKLGQGGAIGAWAPGTNNFSIPRPFGWPWEPKGTVPMKTAPSPADEGSPPPADEGSPPGVGPRPKGPWHPPGGRYTREKARRG